MSTHIEDLERAEYEAKQEAYLKQIEYNQSVKRTIAQTKEIWGFLSVWLSDMTNHINSLRSTEWIPHSVSTSTINHRAKFPPCKVRGDEEHMCSSDVGLQWAYFAHNTILYGNGGKNTVSNPLDCEGGLERIPFLPFLEETLTFEIKTTNSALKRGEFDRFIENPPKGYSVMGTESYELFQKKGHKLIIQLVLDKKYDFKSWHYRKYSILKTLKYFENQFSKFKKWNDFYLVQCSSDLLNLANGTWKISNRSRATKRLLQHLEWISSNDSYLTNVQRVLEWFRQTVNKVEDTKGGLRVSGGYEYQPYNLILDFMDRFAKIKRDNDVPNKLYWSKEYTHHNSYFHTSVRHCNLVDMDFGSVCSLGNKTPTNWTHSPVLTRYLMGLSSTLIKIGSLDTLSEYLFTILSWDGRKETMTEDLLSTYLGVFDPANEEDKDIPVYIK